MAVAGKSRSSFHIEKCDFNEVILNKMFYFVVLICINCPLTEKYISEKPIVNFKQQKDRRILMF